MRRHPLQIGHRHVRRRQRQQARATPGEQREQQIVFAEALHLSEYLGRGALAGFVGYRMPGFHDTDALGRGAMPIARDRNAGQFALPLLFHRGGHGRSRFAGGRDEGAPAWRWRQVSRDDFLRIGGGHRGAKAL